MSVQQDELDEARAMLDALSTSRLARCQIGFEQMRDFARHICQENDELKANLAEQTRNCNRHPDAPHGPDGHKCQCQSWSPGEAS